MSPPRKLRTLPNVKIQYATYHCCVVHGPSDKTCRVNVKRDYLPGWRKACDNLLIWHYDQNHFDFLFPFPNMRIVGTYFREFADSNGRGIFIQGCGANAEFSDLRAYVTSSLCWNPYQDVDALIDEFLQLYYGPAANPIRKWIDLVHDCMEASGKHTNIGFPPDAFGMDDQLGHEGMRLFEEADRMVASDPELRKRVEKISITARRLVIEPVWWNAMEAPRRSRVLNTPLESELRPLSQQQLAQLRPLAREFFQLCEKHGITVYMEGGLTERARNAIRTYYGLGDNEKL